ncbi:MAG TPA: TIGR00730 family Rossman fold protein [Thermoanaerobaculia bacterium]|jgi:hypothetical protein|nr:TIGR00730 family Rossman fold protein [Thermoanaerobaculia bacterium]
MKEPPPDTPPLGSVCVFCGSSAGRDPRYLSAARAFGATLAAGGRRLVYGGGRVGLMGALADGALAAGGTVVGVIPEPLVGRELAHQNLSELRVVASMHERKAQMAELADAFVALPGGIGTLEELFEVWSWGMLGLHRKPCGLLDVAGYFAALLTFLRHAEASGFVPAAAVQLLVVDGDAERLLAEMAARSLPLLPRQLDEDRT